MAAILAEDGDQQIGAAVDDLGVIGEVRRGVDHAKQLDNLDLVQRAGCLLHGGQKPEAGKPGMFIGLLPGHVGAHLAGVVAAIRLARPLP